MKWMIIGLLVVGVLAALSATIVTVTLPSAFGFNRPVVESDEGLVEILVATRDLGAMTIVDSDSIASKFVEREHVPQGALANSVQVVGQVLVKPVLAGQPFTNTEFASGSSGVSIAATLPEGFRAMGILLSDDSGIEELLYPGSIVDVVASFRLPAPNGGTGTERVSATILQKVQVLSVGTRTIVSDETVGDVVGKSAEPSRRRVVTLMVNTEQAKALQLAVTHGTVSLALRNPLDDAAQNPHGTYLSDLSKELADRIAMLAEGSEPKLPLTPQGAAAAPAPAGTAAPTSVGDAASTQATVIAEPQYWVTTIYHGRVKETESFPLAAAQNPSHPTPATSDLERSDK